MKVSVSLITYNHAPFIRQAIESALMQQTNFDYEILIGEDDSNDGTRDIVKEYQAKYPDKIRLFLHDRKDVLYIDGKPTGRRNFVHTWKQARGQYIARLEGDDFWTSPHKLQKQADYLDSHPECSLCFHDVMVMYEEGTPSHPYPFALRKPSYTLAEFLKYRVVPPTCGVMMRNGLFPDFPDWFNRVAFADQPLYVLCAEHGDMGFLDEVMGTYRIHRGGFWSGGFHQSAQGLPLDVLKSRYAADVTFLESVDAHLAYKYHHLLRERIAGMCYQLVSFYQREDNWAKMRTYLLKGYRAKSSVPEFPWTFVVKSALVAFLPFLYRFYRLMKLRRTDKPGK